MDENALKKAIERYHDYSILLEKQGGPSANGELFEELIGLMEDILAWFGLPPTGDNQDLLESLAAERLVPADIIITLLKKKASGVPNLSPLEHFATGIAKRESPFNVLPAMGFSTHVYTLYLYDIALKHHEALIPVYNELYRSQKYLNEIGKLDIEAKKLKSSGLMFLSGFLQRSLE